MIKKKRYIYAAFVGGFVFLFCYMLLNINVLFSLPLAIIGYVAGIFIYKEKDIKYYDSNVIMDYYFKLSKLSNYISKIDDNKIIQSIKDINVYSEKILATLKQRPDKITQVYDFFDYYLPLLIKLTDYYVNVNLEKEKNNEDKEYISKYSTYMKQIVVSFERLDKNMKETKKIDMQTEIKVFEKISGIDKVEIEKKTKEV